MPVINDKRYRGPLRAVILDWGGTTIDYGSFAPVSVIAQLLSDRGLTVSAREARSGLGRHKKDQIRDVLRQPEVSARWLAQLGSSPTEEDVQSLFAEYVPAQMACLERFSTVIPGVPEAIRAFRDLRLRVGSSTGYIRAMLNRLLPLAASQGYAPDCSVTADEVPAGRPLPWMCFRNMQALDVYPPAACVKIGDTVTDMEEGRNAGMWVIGIIKTGNEVGLLAEEQESMPADELRLLMEAGRKRLLLAGAHYTCDTLRDSVPLLEELSVRLKEDDCP